VADGFDFKQMGIGGEANGPQGGVVASGPDAAAIVDPCLWAQAAPLVLAGPAGWSDGLGASYGPSSSRPGRQDPGHARHAGVIWRKRLLL